MKIVFNFGYWSFMRKNPIKNTDANTARQHRLLPGLLIMGLSVLGYLALRQHNQIARLEELNLRASQELR